MVKKINEAEFSEVKNSRTAVVDFNATWCGPCKIFAVDVDDNQTLAIKNKIQSIPAVVIFKNGEPVDRQIGFVPKAQLVEFIEKNIG